MPGSSTLRNSMLRLVEAWGSPTMLNGPGDDSFFQAATSPQICFGHGTYETEDGPVECSLDTCLELGWIGVYRGAKPIAVCCRGQGPAIHLWQWKFSLHLFGLLRRRHDELNTVKTSSTTINYDQDRPSTLYYIYDHSCVLLQMHTHTHMRTIAYVRRYVYRFAKFIIHYGLVYVNVGISCVR